MDEGVSAAVSFSVVFFYLFAAMSVMGALGVAVLRNIIYSAFSLLLAFAGVVGLYAYLSADLLAAVQLMVYVGGIMVLILFAVMLTNRITDAAHSNPSQHRLAGLLVFLAVTAVLLAALLGHTWPQELPAAYEPTAAVIGAAFLGPYLLPFEVAGVLLLAALVAAVVVARKEVKDDASISAAKSRGG